jgi:hypothetical protein
VSLFEAHNIDSPSTTQMSHQAPSLPTATSVSEYLSSTQPTDHRKEVVSGNHGYILAYVSMVVTGTSQYQPGTRYPVLWYDGTT